MGAILIHSPSAAMPGGASESYQVSVQILALTSDFAPGCYVTVFSGTPSTKVSSLSFGF